MNFLTLVNILNEIEYKDWHFLVNQHKGILFVQARWLDGIEEQVSREWLISPEFTKSQVIQTVLALVLMAEEHEAREAFRYKNRKIFGPHFDAETMVAVASRRVNLDISAPVPNDDLVQVP